ncbi:hypothetical protein COCON_G00002530 [Conger conger]|uniref:ZP domain-containing protein n=1 Tax=Conger conger TaxID=82655 RepID=A0A9Q1I7F1_CONCO|nr:hypothetical protein COCON_G00002530 [Conger conger]
MGPFLLSLCVFSCGFYSFLCERHNKQRGSAWTTVTTAPAPHITDSGAVVHTQGFLGRGDAIENKSQPPLPWPYLSLPMFQHSIAPLVNKELMRPSRLTGQGPMPGNLKKLLLPVATQSPTRPSPRSKDVAFVTCQFNKIRVTVHRKYLGSQALRSQLSLGTCGVSNQTENYFIFFYDVSECGRKISMINNQLVFANTLYYTPDKPKGLIRTAVPFALQVLCLYNRFYYSYKIGYLPEIKTQQFFMSMIPSGDFTLTTCNAEWQRLPESTGYIIGSPMYFEASLPSISWDQRLYVSFCYATRSRNIGNTLHYMVIGEYGCMADSAVPGSRARFVRHERNVLRFVVEAFVFEGVPEEHLYMHCEMFVADVVPTEMAKSCTYNSTAGRWEELYGDPQVCSCCDSTCVTNASAAALPATKKMVTSGSWMLESEGGAVPGEATVEWDEITPTETRTVTESMATTRRRSSCLACHSRKSSGCPDCGAFSSVDF